MLAFLVNENIKIVERGGVNKCGSLFKDQIGSSATRCHSACNKVENEMYLQAVYVIYLSHENELYFLSQKFQHTK